MNILFGFMMFLCIVPVLVICYYQIYPKNWQDRKLVFGVQNREEYRTGDTRAIVDGIVQKYRGQAKMVMIGGILISTVLLLLKGMVLCMIVWTVFVLVAIGAINVPYFCGNKEMKALKRRLGLSSREGMRLVDLNSAGVVHGLQKSNVIGPNLAGAAIVLFAVLIDLKVISLGRGWFVGSFLLTVMQATFWIVGLLVTVLACLMDSLRNEVISMDSDVNANYNRAKKKNLADFMNLFLWVNVVLMALWMVVFLVSASEMILFGTLAVYLILLMAGVALFVMRERKIDERYQKEISIVIDDDDDWIGGMFYYNPKDKRFNIEKRVGVGATINLAHPLGKVFGIFAALSIVATVLMLVWIGMLGATPLSLRVENEKVICHQLRDEYVIPLGDVQSVEWGENLQELHLARISGVGMDTVLKGIFFVDEQSGCRVFLNPKMDHYIKIVTADRIYYVNGEDEQETRKIYEIINK